MEKDVFMNIHYQISKDIPVVAETDVLVIGGGPGGMSAAVMAARQGCRVMLAESSGGPGGMAYLGEISPFMSNHLNGSSLDAPLYVEWNRKMWELEGRPLEEFSDDVKENLPLSKEIAMLSAEALLEEAHVECLYHHDFFDVVVEDGRISAALFFSKSGLCAIRAKMYVDATGDGDVAWRAGCPYEFGNAEGYGQPMTLCFKLTDVDIPRMPSREEINRLYDEAKAAGELDCPRENLLWFMAPGNNSIHFNTTRIVKKCGFEGKDLSDAEKEGRRQMLEIIRFLRRRVPGFERARLLSVGSRIGVRESRRILGLHYQTVEDFKQCRKYSDSIARVVYHVDIHNPAGSGTSFMRLPPGEWYELSIRSLVPQKCRNLLMGCRAISVDHVLYSSLRIMPVVCSIGQAAGMGAAMAVTLGVYNDGINSVEVHDRLVKAGARLVSKPKDMESK